jgi:hypothetical protein
MDLTPKQRERRIKELKAALARGCAGPAKFARRVTMERVLELRRLEKETP